MPLQCEVCGSHSKVKNWRPHWSRTSYYKCTRCIDGRRMTAEELASYRAHRRKMLNRKPRYEIFPSETAKEKGDGASFDL